MKIKKVLLSVGTLILLLSVGAYSGANSKDKKSEKDSASAEAFLGRWDLTLKAPDREYPSWLEVSLDGGQLKAQMVGRWGNARPLPRVEISNGTLTFVSPKEEESSKSDMVFEAKLVGKGLAGTVNGQNDGTWTWTGERAASLKKSGTPKWGKPVELFNGKDLTGWKLDKENPALTWKVEDGTLVSPGHGPELINTSQFGDFKLHIEFNCGPGANSGIYLRGRYEVQVETDSVEEPSSHHTGGVYGFLAPVPEPPRKPGEWQSFDITLIGHVVGSLGRLTEHLPSELPGLPDWHEELRHARNMGNDIGLLTFGKARDAVKILAQIGPGTEEKTAEAPSRQRRRCHCVLVASTSNSTDGATIRSSTACGFAESCSGYSQGVENALKIKGRAADGFKHIGGCGLLLQRLPQLIEQPRVLDGDHRLRGEVLRELNLLFGE
jgi:hypothetical protein